MNILITGGAGFIGSHLAKRLSDYGHVVMVLDNLSAQIHGPDADFPKPLPGIAHCIRGDVGDRELMRGLIASNDVVVHLAADTGTGQSMYAVERYERTNILGTAVMLDILMNDRNRRVAKIIVASSRAVYGEGQYHCRKDGTVFPRARLSEMLVAGQFEPVCPVCGAIVDAVPTSEDAPFSPSSFYGLTKQVQEQMVLMFAEVLELDGIALRYQNVYGPGQSLKNPYTGILAVFSNLARAGRPIDVFEDGQESRDFVFIDDVVEATTSCLAPQVKGVHALNVGSGTQTSVIEVANAVARHFDTRCPVNVTGAFRKGDIRHNVADISRMRALTGYSPRWSFERGLRRFLAWAEQQAATDIEFDRSLSELTERGLLGRSAREAAAGSHSVLGQGGERG